MKILKHTLLSLLALIILVVIAGLIILNNIKTKAIPDYSKNIELTGLTSEVNIFRDAYAIPHIYAKNENDLYRAVGFTMAQDRLWQMDLLRRVTLGRLSEILGKDQVNTDLLLRALRFQEKSEKILSSASPEIIQALESFSDGVNEYINNYPLPPEFIILGYKPELWKPIHSINLIGYMSWDLTSGWNTELLLHQIGNIVSKEHLKDLIPDMNSQNTAVYPDFQPNKNIPDITLLSVGKELEKIGAQVFSGSNNWAISGKKSVNGKPILANDMHLGFMSPGIWYQMHQNVEGQLNVSGLVLPGQPFAIVGHNDSIAWGMTNVAVDDLDFYAEIVNQDSTHYLIDGEWKELLIKKEIIQTKEGENIEKKLRFTHRGPIINDFKKSAEFPISIHWLGNEMSNEIRTVYKLNRANNWSDFRNAVKTFTSISQNIVYADVQGNIGLQCSAGIPIRKGNGIQIYRGDSSIYDWKGLVPFEELPFEFNPERAYVSSANNKTVSEDYPYYISHWFSMPNRIDRIRELLEEKDKYGIEDFKQIQSDIKSKKAERFTPVFLNALETENDLNTAEKNALNFLKEWNYELCKQSIAATLFEILYRKTGENIVKDELPEELFSSIMGQKILIENLLITILNKNTSPWVDNIKTSQTETFQDIIIQSFKETVEELIQEFGTDTKSWEWGKLHTFTIQHPLGVVDILNRAFKLNKGPFEMPGSYHTVSPFSYSYNNLYHVVHGASQRNIFDVQNWDASETVIPTGNSGIPASDFYLDQTELYINYKYHPDPFTKNEVEKAAKFSMKLLPKTEAK